MNPRQSRLALLLALLALVAALALRLGPEPETGTSGDRVWEVVPDQVQQLERRVGDRSLRVERGEGGWWIRSPFEAPADRWWVEDVLRELERAERGIRLDETGQADSFGLGNPPELAVELIDAEGEVQRLAIGREAFTGARTYVRAADGGIAAVDARLDRIRAPALQWRDKAVLRFELPRVERVERIGPKGRLELRADPEAGLWWLEGHSRADAQRVDDLLSGLASLRFVQVDALEQPYPEEAEHRLRLHLSTGESKRLAVVSRATGELWAEGGVQGRVEPADLALLDQGPADLYDRSAVPLPDAGLQRLDLRMERHRWRIERSEAGWRLDDAPMEEANRWLNDLEAIGVKLRARSPQTWEEAAGEIAIERVDGERWILEIGPATPEGRAMQDARGGAPYWIEAEPLERLMGELDR